MSDYFGTNGVRGKFETGGLTPELALKLAQATGIYLCGKKGTANKTVIVARDCRTTGEIMSAAVISGVASIGCTVIDLGIASSPTAEWMVKKLQGEPGGCAGCIIISASHNPPEWTALKVVDSSGVAISRERGKEIEKIIDENKAKIVPWNKVGKIVRYERATSEHVGAICRLVDVQRIRTKKPKIVIDCGNGAATAIAPRLLKALGVEIISLNSHPDGSFPGRPSEPIEANVRELIEMVKSSKADAGAAWDGDGDRIIFVDEKGNYVIGDKVLALSVIWKKPSKGDVIVTTVATSKAVEDIATKFGANVTYTAIGAPYLSSTKVSTNIVPIIRGEEVGGVIWPELSMAKDGFMTLAKLAEAICEKPLSRWLEEVPKYYNVKHRIEASDSKTKKAVMDRVMAYANKNKLRINTLDGMRIDMDNSWVIVRPSGTENYVRVFAEAKSELEAKKLADEYLRVAKGK